jgi:hypothetical protein
MNMTGPEQLDLYGTRSRGWRIVIALARVAAVLLGLAIGFVGAVFYGLRCFDTCPSDPAEDAILQVLFLSLVAFGLIVIVAAATLGTRAAAAGTWISSFLGVLMVIGGVVALVLVPPIRFPGDRSGTVIYSLTGVAVGVAVVLFGRRLRRGNR